MRLEGSAYRSLWLLCHGFESGPWHVAGLWSDIEVRKFYMVSPFSSNIPQTTDFKNVSS